MRAPEGFIFQLAIHSRQSFPCPSLTAYLLQEYEDKVPFYVEQTLDRLEAKRIIRDWNRNEWKIETTIIGLDIIMTPLLDDEDA